MVYQTAPLKNTAPTTDDAFHILRDCRALYLKLLGQLLQDAEHLPAASVQAFQLTVGKYFDEMTSSNRKSGFDVTKELTASRISLVGESDLELEIRLGEFSARLMETTGSDLWRVYLRFVTLLRRPDMSPGENPLGPKGIALGLIDFSAQQGENHAKTMARVDRLEDYFSRHLAVLYKTLDDFLAERHVEMAQPSIISGPDSTPTMASNSLDPAAALQKKLLGKTGQATAESGPISPTLRAQLFGRLDELDKSGRLVRPPPVFSGTASQPSLEALIPGLFANQDEAESAPPLHTLNSAALDIPDNTPEAATINALALIFENIFASSKLPEAIKDILAGLQTSLLKAAMLDAGFFNRSRHPARLLLDKIVLASQGLSLDVPPRHPLCASLQAIATHVRNEFADDLKLIEQQLEKLDKLIAERDNSIARSSQAYVPLLHQAELQNQAGYRCRQVIEQYLAPNTPVEIASFLRTYGRELLQAVWQESGEQSADWQEHEKLFKDLLWSIQPKIDIEERKQLAKMLQPMLRHLNAGMARIKVPEAVQAAFLDTCFALQTAAMRGTTSASSVSDIRRDDIDSTKVTISELTAGNLRLKVFAKESASSGLRPPPAPFGSWLQLSLNLEDGAPPLCGRLCQGSPESVLLLIANPDWDFALAIHPDILENMFADKTAYIFSAHSLFDAAAEKALQQTTKL